MNTIEHGAPYTLALSDPVLDAHAVVDTAI
jgi:hypothetical protein